MSSKTPEWMRLPSRDSLHEAGTYAVWAAAILASMSALYGMALDYGGWPWQVALLFPVCVDVYWVNALGVAMSPHVRGWRKVAAMAHFAAAFSLSAVLQLAYHELRAGAWHLGSVRPLAVAAIALVPLLAGAALTHLTFLARSARQQVSSAGRKRAAVTVPPKRSAPRPDRATVPVADHAATVPSVPADTVPSVPETAPPAEQPAVPAATGTDDAMPAPLKPGGRPDPIAIEAARAEWESARRGGRIHSDRSLTKAVNERYGYTVIGRTAAAGVIEDERARRRTA